MIFPAATGHNLSPVACGRNSAAAANNPHSLQTIAACIRHGDWCHSKGMLKLRKAGGGSWRDLLQAR